MSVLAMRVRQYIMQDNIGGENWKPNTPKFCEDSVCAKEKGDSICYEPMDKTDSRRVYAVSYPFLKAGEHLTTEEVNRVIEYKQDRIDKILKMASWTVYNTRVDYCQIKVVSTNDVPETNDTVILRDAYMSFEKYAEQFSEEYNRLLHDASEEGEQERIAFAEKLLQHLILGIQELSEAGLVHEHIQPKTICLSEAKPEERNFYLDVPGFMEIVYSSTHSKEYVSPYDAPELANDPDQEFDWLTDLYSAGLVVYEILNEGCFPFESETTDRHNEQKLRNQGTKEIPEPLHGTPMLRYIVRKLLAFERGNRYASIVEATDDLRKLTDETQNRNVNPMSVVTVKGVVIAPEKEDSEKIIRIYDESDRESDDTVEKVIPVPHPIAQDPDKKNGSSGTEIPKKESPEKPPRKPYSDLYDTHPEPTPQPSPPSLPPPQPPRKNNVWGCLIAILVIITIVLIIMTFQLVGELSLNSGKGQTSQSDSDSSLLMADNETEAPTEEAETLPETEAPIETEEITEEPTTEQSMQIAVQVPTESPKNEAESTYSFVGGKYTWEEAEQYCEDHGGHLATIHSIDDWNEIMKVVKEAQKSKPDLKYMWLGATSRLTDEMNVVFTWVDGSESNFVMSEIDLWYYNESLNVLEPSGYDAYEWKTKGNLVREPYLLLWNTAPRGGASTEWSLNDVPDLTSYSNYKDSNMGFIMQIDE